MSRARLLELESSLSEKLANMRDWAEARGVSRRLREVRFALSVPPLSDRDLELAEWRKTWGLE